MSPDQMKAIYEAAASGRQIEAVRIYQAATGASLTEAMAYVEELAGQVTVKRQSIGADTMPEAEAGMIPHVPPPPPNPTRIVPSTPGSPLEDALGFPLGAVTPQAAHIRGMSPQDSAAFVTAIRNGQPIVAIQLLRRSTGLGLKEAKDVVDELSTAVRANLAGQPRGFRIMPRSGPNTTASPAAVAFVIAFGLSILFALFMVIAVAGR